MVARKQILDVEKKTPLWWLQFILYGSLLLYFARNILVPISFALLISFVLYPVCAWLERKGTRRLTAVVLSLSLLIVLGALLTALLINQFVGFFNEWPALQTKLTLSIAEFSKMLVEVFGISKGKQSSIINNISNDSGANLISFLQGAVSTSAFSAVMLVLVPVYSVLILYYRSYWMKILGRLFPQEDKDSLREMIGLTIKTYYNFIKGMAVVYLIVGTLNSIGLVLLGIPHAILFGFIASVLTFIPYVGIIVGSLLPMALAWITYDSIWYPIGIIGVFTFVQYLEANVIFPLAVSSRLHVNTMVMLVAIFAGGILWGMSGMILFVPFVGIAKLIADHNPKWKTLSMILGMEGE